MLILNLLHIVFSEVVFAIMLSQKVWLVKFLNKRAAQWKSGQKDESRKEPYFEMRVNIFSFFSVGLPTERPPVAAKVMAVTSRCKERKKKKNKWTKVKRTFDGLKEKR